MFPSTFMYLMLALSHTIFALPTDSANNTRRGVEGVIMSSWYPSWLGSTFPPEHISWSKYNVVSFAFGIPTSDPSVISLDPNIANLLTAFVSEAKVNNVKALLSLGGWTGSEHYSSCMSTDSSRATFINAILELVQTYSLDGIDFDWEYPGKNGNNNSNFSPDDTANFLALLRQLRQTDVGQLLVVSAAVAVTTFVGADGSPMTDVSAFASVVDYIEIMAYDIWGSWSPDIGPNAPLYDSCGLHQAGSVDSAIHSWVTAGFPANKIVVGVASYGRAFTVSGDAASQMGNYPTFDPNQTPEGDGDTIAPSSASNSGLFNFASLINGGYLTGTGDVSSGMVYKFDECSQTPYLYNPARNIMISYDDPKSFAAKGQYIKDQSLGGFAMWHAAGDSNDILLDAIRSTVQ